ncbi:SDR family oxidoreductase [Nonomuraea sp. NPDC049419]|uniref:SDR family NAD(P)-dependent oxidoreductase n=1 Tax=Nonomuraea sp. NPDC049419 TaxID=3155772 RepID=UPI003448198B
MELQGKIALVTGGTSGIGLATARRLAREGAEVVISGRDGRRGKDAERAAQEDGSIRYVPADMADLGSVAELARQSGPVDILVNNAGIFPTAATLDQTPEGYEEIFATNVRGPFFLVAALVPHMLAKGEGSIVNISTLAAHRGFAGASVYGASKAALEALTRAWAKEFGDGGVRVNAVSPGPVRTEGVVAAYGEEGNEPVARGLGIPRTARPEELAEAIYFLASPRAGFVNGTTFFVDLGGGVF